MVLIDTDTVRLLLDAHPSVVRRLSLVDPMQVWISSVTVEETVSGYLALLNKARSMSGSRAASTLTPGDAHERFTKAVVALRLFQIMPHTDEAEKLFQSFPAKVKRIGAQDCRIAALAMTRGMTVVTRNVRDFTEIGAPCEDWSRP